jgi:hypothetical protein
MRDLGADALDLGWPAPAAAAEGWPAWYEAAELGLRIARLLRVASPSEAALRAAAFLEGHAARAAASPVGRAPQPLDRLASALGLSTAERLMVVMAGMADEHEGYGAAFAALHPRGVSRPTVALFARLVWDEPARTACQRLLGESLLIRLGVIGLGNDGPLPERTLSLADRLWPALNGVDTWPQDHAPLATEAGSRLIADPWLETLATQRALATLARDDGCLVVLHGRDAPSCRDRAGQLATESLRPIMLFDGAAAAEATALAAVFAHCLLRDVTPGLLLGGQSLPAASAALIERFPRPVLLVGSGSAEAARLRTPLVPLEAPPLTRPQRRALWAEAFPELAAHAAELAVRFPVTAETVGQARRDMQRVVGDDGCASLDDVSSVLQARSAIALTEVARLVKPVATWDDLILPPDKLALLRQAAARIRFQLTVMDDWGFEDTCRGQAGVRLLFAGLPGTGKTLAAEVIAHAVRANLLCVDLAQTVSKWIGETEKNLSTVFDQAEATRSVLFFDEADALFGKRTDVTDAHDRYANIETAFLLSRLERYGGIAVLATNLRQNLDAAFVRRFEYIVDFPEPGPTERAAIWRRHIPAAAPLAADVNIQSLAERFPLPGALIRNAALSAAFLAAADGAVITGAHLRRAIHDEYAKAGRACPT